MLKKEVSRQAGNSYPVPKAQDAETHYQKSTLGEFHNRPSQPAQAHFRFHIYVGQVRR